MNYELYTSTENLYRDIIADIQNAKRSITMMYFTINYGEEAMKIGEVLKAQQLAGVHVRVMVDDVGLVVDAPKKALMNQILLKELSLAGIQIDHFRSKHKRTTAFNRLHYKICAIDEAILYIGGSNIGDEYIEMLDLNLKVIGEFGNLFESLYDYLIVSDEEKKIIEEDSRKLLKPLPSVFKEDFNLALTIPGNRKDIRRTLLGLILDARTSIHLRTWYFLPDREIIQALLHQLEQGCQVIILFSNQTRIPLIDQANWILAEKLTKAGAQVWRYLPSYMHAKVAWNDRGDVIFGSANLDSKSLGSNFECSLYFREIELAKQLEKGFNTDSINSHLVLPEDFTNKRWWQKSLAYGAYFVAALL